MSVGGLLNEILRNDRLTNGLGDPEARMLVEWLVERVESLEQQGVAAAALELQAQALCHRARCFTRFVWLWCHRRQRSAALQLAGSERFAWPLPTDKDIDPCELMATICNWEGENEQTRRRAA